MTASLWEHVHPLMSEFTSIKCALGLLDLGQNWLPLNSKQQKSKTAMKLLHLS